MTLSIRLLLGMVWIAIALPAFGQDNDAEVAPATPTAELTTEATSEPAIEPTIEPTIAPMTLTLQVHPIFPPEQAEMVYAPLLNYLRETTPHEYELATARDFHRFWLSIRRGSQPDLVLEDAHLIALRMQRDGYTPLVKASEPATFSLIGNTMNMEPTLDEYIAKPVSSMPSPSLGYMVLQRWYTNPMAQPRVLSNASSWLEAIEMVFAMESEAAIAPHYLVSRYVNLAVVQTSREFPHLTIAASPAVPGAVQQQIRASLVELHNNSDYFSALHELDIDQFVPAAASEYEGLEDWLEGFGVM